MRLCTEADWETACSPTGLRYPYGDTYDAAACNGNDYDPDGGTPQDQDYAVPTGSLGACETPGGIFDMSGNLKEWTGSLRAPGPPPAYAVRGGAYDTPPGGLTCGFDFVVAESTLLFPNLGFRCCCSASALGCPP
jgi:formylglycine-generating enzyme required for sulfatase activity